MCLDLRLISTVVRPLTKVVTELFPIALAVKFCDDLTVVAAETGTRKPSGRAAAVPAPFSPSYGLAGQKGGFLLEFSFFLSKVFTTFGVLHPTTETFWHLYSEAIEHPFLRLIRLGNTTN